MEAAAAASMNAYKENTESVEKEEVSLALS
jgi:hypothetical protein